MDDRIRKHARITRDSNQLRSDDNTSTIIQVLILIASGCLTLAGFLLIHQCAIEEFEIKTIQMPPTDDYLNINETIIYNLSSGKKRTKRETASLQFKEDLKKDILKLMEDPKCKGGCDKVRKKLVRIGKDFEMSIVQLTNLKKEIESVALSCKDDDSKNKEFDEMPTVLGTQQGGGFVPNIHKPLQASPVDQDLAGSNYFQLVNHMEGIPPTGPDSSATGSGPGEVVKTSQQMIVSLPQQVHPVCRLVPGQGGSVGYICMPARNSDSSTAVLPENYYFKATPGARAPEVHVPTAISTQNPYAFPTLSGSPVISPVSAPGSNQMVPVFNPLTGRVSFLNYGQGSVNNRPNFTTVNQNESPLHIQQPVMSQYSVLNQQYLVPQPQFRPQSQVTTQLASPQYSSILLPVPYQPQPPIQHQPVQAVSTSSLILPSVYQPQTSPQFYIPPLPFTQPQSRPTSPIMQCSYVVVPNSPVQTYQFPIVTGVKETLQRSEEPEVTQIKQLDDKKIQNETAAKSFFYDGNCKPGMISCENEQKCIKKENWCDSRIDCIDISDESKCTCKDRIQDEKLCDGYFDCPLGEDELECFGCSRDMFSCNNAASEEEKPSCLSLKHRCDGIRDCPNGRDEVDCLIITEEEQAHMIPTVSYSNGFLYRNWKGTWYHVCSSLSWQLQACSAEFGTLQRSPQESYITLREHPPLLVNENESGIEQVHLCPGAEGAALWVECPMPECGVRTVSSHLKRNQRSQTFPREQYWVDPHPGEEEPQFRSANEAHDFVKDFLNSISIFDKKKYYKRFWGPLVQPYMGVKDINHKRKGEKDISKTDPTQDSWMYYRDPNTYNNFPYYSQNERSEDKASSSIDSYQIPSDYHGSLHNSDTQGLAPQYGNELYNHIEYSPIDTNTPPHPDYFLESFYPQNDENNYPFSVTDDIPEYEHIDYENQPSDYYLNYHFSPFLLAYEEDNRTKREEEARVVGGRQSEPGSWPWLVVIYKDGNFHCGGTILKPEVVLTAAHCMERFQDHYFEVHAGILRRMSYSPQLQIRKVTEVIIHEAYDKTKLSSDIALIGLSSKLKFNRWVLPACLPPPDPILPPAGIICTAIGWGAIYEHGPDPDHLKEVSVPIWPDCKYAVDRLGNEICAGYSEGGRDTCQGDSGGPLLCRLGSNKWYVAGIVSHGEGCARKGEPGVYTRVSIFHDWILQNLEWPRSAVRSSQKTCPGLVCNTGICLPTEYHCDKHIDCLSIEDEENCDGFLRVASIGINKNVNNSSTYTNLSRTKEASDSVTPSHVLVSDTSTDSDLITENTSVSEDTFFEKTKESTSTSEDDILETTTETPYHTTEEAELHSQQLKPLNLTQIYSCEQLNQRILASRLCDGIVDCEDGSDEKFCTCRDKLMNLSPILICDGKIDCHDLTDEKDCSVKCSDKEFYCYNTDKCISFEKRCDRNRDCYHGEDEKGCYALINNELTFDITGKPILLMNGTAVEFQKGSWKSVCNDYNPVDRASTICRSLGFRSFLSKTVEVHENPTNKDGTICQGILVSCSSPENLSWTAPLFIDAMPVALAALISPDWLLAPHSSLFFNDSKVHLSSWFGKSNFSLNILGPYDQYIRIDGIIGIYDLDLVLLHLENPAKISHATVPLPLPTWPTPFDGTERCEAVGMNNEGSIITVMLEPLACGRNQRCYIWDRDDDFCKIPGLVFCHSSFGSYIASVISQNICLQRVITLPDITANKHNIIKHLDEKVAYNNLLYEDICETVRCENGKCLEWSKICDGVSDCFDSRDEADEAWEKKETYCQYKDEPYCTCKPGFIRCQSGECIKAEKFCDGSDDCMDVSDENDCSCAGYLSLARPFMLCDGNPNCKDKSDEDWSFCGNKQNYDCINENKYKCPNSEVCIPRDFLCDGDPDCPENKDEEMCIALRSPVDRPKEGMVFSLLFGQLVPQCLEPNDSIAQIICSVRGFELEQSNYNKIQKINVVMDVFSLINLNSNTSVSLRTNRPFTSIARSDNETCLALYIHCQ
ncbi:serine protease nudel [Halyomorpha halys]|uniref:serine protease nudel n=1 Tax=Halyomorpha halys TaxID=286706 RepID=UPI000D0C876F|nr:serine protease nudel isoform X1 [Halyomorpha halys]